MLAATDVRSLQVSVLKQRLALLDDRLTRIELQTEIHMKSMKLQFDQLLLQMHELQQLMDDSGSSADDDDD